MSEKILVTGSEGLIGKILVKNLSSEFEIFSLDKVNCQREKYYRVDISDFDKLSSVFKRLDGPDYVVHLAADARVNACWDSVLENNIIGTRNVYELARIKKVKKIIFASSNHVTAGYESSLPSLPQDFLINVNYPVRPDSDYGVSKIFGEAIAREYFDLYGLESICLRIGAVLRDDDPTRVEERDAKLWLSHQDLVQLFKKSLEGKVKFGIYYGISDNQKRFYDISNAEKELGYKPRDGFSKNQHVY